MAGFIAFDDKDEEIFTFGKYKGQKVKRCFHKRCRIFRLIQMLISRFIPRKFWLKIQLSSFKIFSKIFLNAKFSQRIRVFVKFKFIKLKSQWNPIHKILWKFYWIIETNKFVRKWNWKFYCKWTNHTIRLVAFSAIGGLQLQVFEENVEKAKEILQKFVENEEFALVVEHTIEKTQNMILLVLNVVQNHIYQYEKPDGILG